MATDLSRQHQPLTDLFRQPSTQAEWEQYRLSDEPLLQGVPPIASGDKMDGQFFPLLFKADSSCDGTPGCNQVLIFLSLWLSDWIETRRVSEE